MDWDICKLRQKCKTQGMFWTLLLTGGWTLIPTTVSFNAHKFCKIINRPGVAGAIIQTGL